MTPGPKPKPAAIAEAQGNPGKRALPQEGVAPDDPLALAAQETIAAHGPPPYMDTRSAGTETAREITDLAMLIWHDLHGKLTRLNLLKATDEIMFAILCRKFAEYFYANRIMDKEGWWYTTSSEHVGELKRPHPAMRMQKDALQAIRDLSEAFGLTPSARQRLFQQLAARAAEQPKLPIGGEQPGAAPPASEPASPIGILGRPAMH